MSSTSREPTKIQHPTPDEMGRFGQAAGDRDAARQAVETPAAPRADAAAELEKARAEAADYKARWIRAQADCQNVMRRLTEEKEAVVQYANAGFARALLPVLDSLERALAAAGDRKDDPVVDGVRLVLEMLRKALADAHIQPIEAVGHPFDPARHEALIRKETADHPPGTVVQEFERGYRIRDRVLRASKVAVAAAPAAESSNPDLPATSATE